MLQWSVGGTATNVYTPFLPAPRPNYSPLQAQPNFYTPFDMHVSYRLPVNMSSTPGVAPAGSTSHKMIKR